MAISTSGLADRMYADEDPVVPHEWRMHERFLLSTRILLTP
jgi:hypothetical protein